MFYLRYGFIKFKCLVLKEIENIEIIYHKYVRFLD